MIKRFYVHNFRCLENFELPVGGLSSTLLIGRNGAGKTTVSLALGVLQKIGRGINRVGKLIDPSDIGHGRADMPVRFELSVSLGDVDYEYVVAFELPQGFRELRVLEEKLSIGGIPRFTRAVAEMRFSKKGSSEDATMPVDWHLVGLPLVQARSVTDPLHLFQQWLARMLILRPIPALIIGDSTDETLLPEPEVTNFGDWWSGLIAHAPSAYASIDTSLRQLLPDLKDIKNPLIAKDARSLEVQFASSSSRLPLPFRLLSDGEKCMFVWALVIAANEAYGPLFCFWDEPDNYLAISEVGRLASDLRKAFKAGGQFVATSHNAEAITRFSDENTFVLHRVNHLEPTQVRSLKDMEYTDLVGSLTRGEIL